MPKAFFAFDRQTARSRDADGRMRVKNCILSVAEVNPYYGREIPDADKLGLRPEQVYELYRDPEALAAGASSFEGLPLMIKHIAQTADEPRKEYIGGSVHNVEFDGKRLRGDLLVWDGEAIDLIESDALSDLSCSYRYKPVMRPGEAAGKKYDGVMTNVQGNHVALVDDGRATGAHVADAALQAPRNSDSPTQGAQAMPLEQPGAKAPEARPAPGSPAGEQNEQANMAMIGQALKQIGVVLQDIHAKISGGVNAPAGEGEDNDPMGVQPQEGDEPDADDRARDAESETDEERMEREAREASGADRARDMELEPAVKGAQDTEMQELGGENGGVKPPMPTAPNGGTPARGANEQPEQVIGAMDARTVRIVNTAVADALKRERARVEALSRAKEDVRYVLGPDLAMDSAADVYRAALVQSGVPDGEIPRGGEKAAWYGYSRAHAAGRGAVSRDVATMANDGAMKDQTQNRLTGLVSKIRVQG